MAPRRCETTRSVRSRPSARSATRSAARAWSMALSKALSRAMGMLENSLAQPSAISYQLSAQLSAIITAISYQLKPAISYRHRYRRSAVSHQPSAISHQPSRNRPKTFLTPIGLGACPSEGAQRKLRHATPGEDGTMAPAPRNPEDRAVAALLAPDIIALLEE